jgi:hypothetical protein
VGSVQRFRNEVSHESIVNRESDKMRLHLRLDVRFRYVLACRLECPSKERGLVCSDDDHKDRAMPHQLLGCAHTIASQTISFQDVAL